MRSWAAGVGHQLALGVAAGIIAGCSSAAFLHGLSWATRTRLREPRLLWLLPVAGLAIGFVYEHLGGRAAGGNTTIFAEIHEPSRFLPRRMAPLVLVSSVATHLFGGSAGREGVAVQMTAGFSDLLPRWLRWTPAGRRGVLIIAIAGGFGAVFGTPIAGTVFALEVPTTGRWRTDRLLGCLTAALVGDRVTRVLGVHHPTYRAFPHAAASLPTLGRCALIGVGCGVVALAFVWLTEQIRLLARRIAWAPLRPAVGGLAVIAMVGLVGNRDYLGLSGTLTNAALAGASIASFAFAGKLVFTAVTLGSGFQGGEVTPLFVIGTTFAAAAGPHIGLPAGVAAAVGFSATFAAAANTPITCTVLAAELFGSAVLPFAAVACVVAFACSTRRSIYAAQRWALTP